MYKGKSNRSDASAPERNAAQGRRFAGEGRSYGRRSESGESRGNYGHRSRRQGGDSENRFGGNGRTYDRNRAYGRSGSDGGRGEGFGNGGYRSREGGYGAPKGASGKIGNGQRYGRSYEDSYGRGGGKTGGRGGFDRDARRGGSDAGKFQSGHNFNSGRPGGAKAENSPAVEIKHCVYAKSPAKGKYYSPLKNKPIPRKGEDEEIRLNKFIANSGVCSRREADTYIQAGVVSVNGTVVTELGTKVKPGDDVRFNGERLKGEQKVYLVMNKPKNYVTTMSDPHAEHTVMELITKEKCPQRIFPVGRLDKATTGVLVFTNDGPLAERLMHPAFETKKIYQVDLDKNLKAGDFNAILEGVTLEDGEIHADALSYLEECRSRVGIEIHSGRNRIVRRIFEHFGYKVKKLDRVYFAGLTKKNLKRGQWRFLTRDEVNFLMMGGER